MPEKSLFKRSLSHTDGEPFVGDLFGRSETAKQLTGYIDRLVDGCVIGIDAPWGEGKTWFAKNWHAYLEKNQYRAIYIDAFQADFTDDPFLIIASDLVNAAKDEQGSKVRKNLIDKAATVGKNMLPLAAKVAIGVAGKAFLGQEDLKEVKEMLSDATSDVAKASEKYIQRRLNDHELSKKSVENFKNVLQEFAAAQSHPCVVLIDELDRCRPTFAVQFIERIKHFFDVPNLVFVLLINKEQLESAIKGVYGPIDAHAYLGKFVNFFLTLPKYTSTTDDRDFNKQFLKSLMKRYEYQFNDNVSAFLIL